MSQFTNEVVGPLTDAELRAVPVPVSGTVTSLPSGTQDVNVTNPTLAVTGPLTDTQLRATPVAISGTVSVGAPTTTATITNVSVGTSVVTLSASNASKTRVVIYNETGTLFVKYGTGASASSYTTRLTANTIHEISGYAGIVTGIKAAGTTPVIVTEVGI
jgi:hypothetical protein